MTDQKNYISVLLIVLSLSFAGCKEKQQEQTEIKDKYALPSGYTGSLNPVSYDFEFKNPQWVGVEADAIEKFLGLQRTVYQGHCGLLDFEKKTFSIRITGTKKDRVLKFLYLGQNRIVFLDDKTRGYIVKFKHSKKPNIDEDRYYYYFYPLSDISDEKKIDNLDPYNITYEFRIASIDGSKYKSMNDCEQETIEQEKVQQSIDEEHEKVKGDLAPP
ncbi:hypothetical protein [Leptospira interrogans]|uniref:hypothetical protein n=1 Tax=Leptospira interrogans TaxID=173 RepID=UPI0007744116|nr:hypothetical protein [Leptospira interrogans]UMQ57992.1 hypothetical protein FH585_17465 [Leptospira interrogans]UNE67943.1 hypothetical protein FH588_06770 [Leptospira interrogans]